MQGMLQLAMLEEVRVPEPPIRLAAVFFEPGSPAQVAAELRALPDVVVGVSAPLTGNGKRTCDVMLRERGVPPLPRDPASEELGAALEELGLFDGDDDNAHEGSIDEGLFRGAPVFETNADGVFCALQNRRLPSKRHPLGMQYRVEELAEDHVVDDGGELWHRRIEEIEAAGAALCAHRYAVGHACWFGRPGEGTIVLPGTSLPERFASEGVLPPVERLQLPRA